jgi:hypothetical protein
MRTTIALAAAAFVLTVVPSASALEISEMRTRGLQGANDEYVEIHNEDDQPHTVQTFDASPGYAVVGADGGVRFVIPVGTVIPPGGHYLGVNSTGYGLDGYAQGDRTFTTDLGDADGVALFATSDPAHLNVFRRLDAFGFENDPPLYREGGGFHAPAGFSLEMAFVRTRDTGDNLADFRTPDTNGTAGIQDHPEHQLLGAPGPENSASHRTADDGLEIALLDPSEPANAPPNLLRDHTSDPAKNSTFGTLVLRRRITNRTDQPLARVRFRVTDLSTFPEQNPTADLRPRSSGPTILTVDGTNRTVYGTTLDQPPDQPNGGGFNSTIRIPTITAANLLQPGESVEVQLAFGLQDKGDYRLCLRGEAQSTAAGGLIGQAGNTETLALAVPPCGVQLEPGPAPEDEPQPEQPVVTSGGDPVPVPAPPARDTTAPRFLDGLRLARTRFDRRTRVTFRLDEPAKVVLRLQRRRRSRFVPLRRRTITVAAKVGVNRLRLSGRGLRGGRHRLVAVATDAGGNRSLPARKRFRIVRR